jgi:hypothetical protein
LVHYGSTSTRLFTVGAGHEVNFFDMELGPGTATSGGLIKAEAGSIVTLRSVAIHDGVATGSGGCVWAAGASVVASYADFSACTAGGYGGAIWGENADLVLVLSAIHDGDAYEGGGIAAAGSTIQIITSELHDLHAEADGGAIAVSESTLELSADCSITSTDAQENGGAIAASVGSSVDLGSADPGAADLGALGKPCVAGDLGGAVYPDGASSMIGGDIRYGTATLGGGIAAVGASQVVLVDGVVTDSSAVSGGGAYLDGGSSIFIQGSLVGNTATAVGGLGGYGGAIHCPDCSIVIEEDGSIGSGYEGNSARDGGNIWLGVGATLDLFDEGAVLNGSASRSGGNVYSSGGLVHLHPVVSIYYDNAEVYDGVAAEDGGNFYLSGGSLVADYDTNIRGGQATRGGGIFASGAEVSLLSERIDTLFGSSGVLGLTASGAQTYYNGPIRLDGQAEEGGAIFATNSTIDLLNVIIELATNALYLESGSDLAFRVADLEADGVREWVVHGADGVTWITPALSGTGTTITLGRATLSEPGTWPFVLGPLGMVPGDDLAFIDLGLGEPTVKVYDDPGADSAAQTATIDLTPSWVQSLGVGDLTGDGVADLAVGAPPDVRLYAGPVLGDVAPDAAAALIAGEGVGSAGEAIDARGDVDGDGAPDLVATVLVGGEEALGIFTGPLQSVLSARDGVWIGGPEGAASLWYDHPLDASVDWNADGYDDVLANPRGSEGAGLAQIWFGPFPADRPYAEFSAALESASLTQMPTAIGDFNADGWPDLGDVGHNGAVLPPPYVAGVYYGPFAGLRESAGDLMLTSPEGEDILGISSVGDATGDGAADLVVVPAGALTRGWFVPGLIDSF